MLTNKQNVNSVLKMTGDRFSSAAEAFNHLCDLDDQESFLPYPSPSRTDNEALESTAMDVFASEDEGEEDDEAEEQSVLDTVIDEVAAGVSPDRAFEQTVYVSGAAENDPHSAFWSSVLPGNPFDIKIKSGGKRKKKDVNHTPAWEKFCRKPCCLRNCLLSVPTEVLFRIRGQVCDLDYRERHVFLMGKLMGSLPLFEFPGAPKNHLADLFFDVRTPVCVDAFCFAFCSSPKTLTKLRSQLLKNGLLPIVHKNYGKKGNSALAPDIIEEVKMYLMHKAEKYGLPMPTPPTGTDSQPKIYFESYTVKKEMWKDYATACDLAGKRHVSYSSFLKIWKREMPHICVKGKRTDFCFTCVKYRDALKNIAPDDGQKLLKMEQWRAHVDAAKLERKRYHAEIQRCAELHKKYSLGEGDRFPDDAEDSCNLYSFDFAQSISYPSYADQPGYIFFKVAWRVNLFGMVDDPQKTNTYHAYDESQCMGKDGKESHGPNAVISMTDHHLHTNDHNEKRSIFYCDNCSGQNKNRYLMAYWAWQVDNGFRTVIEVHFMPVGHTKFSPDRFFAWYKKLFTKADVSLPRHLKEVGDQVARSRAYLYGETEGWQWREWKKFLDARYAPIQGIQKLYHFVFSKRTDGVVIVEVRASLQAQPEVRVMTKSTAKRPRLLANQELLALTLPRDIAVGGLSQERKAYLKKEISPFVAQACREEFCKDL